jgi:hypothetical protein
MTHRSPSGTPVTVRRFESNAEADRAESANWRALSDADRVLLAWTLSRDLWQLRGEQPCEPGLHRSVESVRRR